MRMLVWLCPFVLALPSAGQSAVDPAVLGTWKLDTPGVNVLWSIREDGVYRVHGTSARPRQAGRIEAQGGRWSVKSPTWIDSGTYTVQGEKWTVTAQLGTGSWSRVWNPAQAGATQVPGAGTCALLSLADAARALLAPVTGGPDPRSPGGCVYTSQLDNFDSIRVTSIPSRRQSWFLQRDKAPKDQRIPIPGIGEDAFAELRGSTLIAHILRGPTQYEISMKLTPDIYPGTEDLPVLVALARAASRRLGGG